MDKIYNDCVHGHIKLPAICTAIIDTPCFQRLRNLKQIGTGYYVFPSACHNRFEHSLGVCFLTGKMVDALNKNATNDEVIITDTEKMCLQIAGLCHDLGHGPFSHTWEKFLEEVCIGPVEWTHEKSSTELLDLILQEEKVKTAFKNEHLDANHIKFIKDLILGDGSSRIELRDRVFLFEIISNEINGIDVDKWDYILRDGHMMNIRVHFDYQRLMEFARVIKTSDTRYHICYRDKEAINIFYMFQGRAELHYLAYNHRVVKVIEKMLVDALISAHNNGFLFRGYELPELHKHPEVFMKLTDHIMFDILDSTGDNLEEARSILTRIQYRDFYQNIDIITPIDSNLENQVRETCKHFPEFLILKAGMKIDKDLIKRVYIFQKSDVNNAKLYSDWTNAPVFPLDMDKLERVKLFIYSKKKVEEAVLQRFRKTVSDLAIGKLPLCLGCHG